MRELEEETGFKADSVLESSDVVVSDPGAEFRSSGLTPKSDPHPKE